MTIINQSSRRTVNGNGTQTVFDYNFLIPSAADAALYLVDAMSGNTTRLPSSAWSLSGAGNPLGGTFTYPLGAGVQALQATQKLTLVRETPNTQLASFQNQGGFYPRALEAALDRIVMQIQQIADNVDRTLRLSVASPSGASTILPNPSSQKLIGWNAAADGLQNFDASMLATLVAYGTARADLFSGDGTATVFTLTGDPGNQANLDVSVSGATKRPGEDYYWLGGNTLTFVTPPASGTNNILVRYFQGLPGLITDADDVLYKPSGAGAVGRTVEDKLRDTVNIKDFGAAVDGTTDDTLAFQAAINTGKDILLADGTMVVGLVTMANVGQRIIGTRNCTIKRKNSTPGNFITVTASDVSLIGFTIDGNSSNQTYEYNVREVFGSGAKIEIRKLRVINAMSMGIGLIGGALAPTIVENEVENVGDFGIFVNNAGGGTDPAYGICEGNLVVEFGIQGAGGGASTSVGIGIRSAIGGWRIVNNIVRNITPRTNDQLGIECWTNSNNMIVDGNQVDMAVANSGEFGLSITGYGSVVSNNLVLGTSSYAIEIIDRAVVATGNVLRSPTGAGIAVNLNTGHADPGDVMSITGNVIEDANTTETTFAGIVIDGDPGTTPIAITIAGNTVHGLARAIRVGTLVKGYTVSGNTCWNTGGTISAIQAFGSDGAVTGNSINRVADAGSGKQTSQINVGGSGVIVEGNRLAGNGRVDNAILINAGAANVLIGPNLSTGANNYVFSSSSEPTVIVQGGAASSGVALNAANRAVDVVNLSNNNVVTQQTATALSSYTVANLPTSGIAASQLAYASNGRKNGEGAGAGTGVMVFRDGTAWRACNTGATVEA
jgi:hypothetical protein